MRIKNFDFSVNLLRAILWQYDNAERLKTWLQNKQNNLNTDHVEFWQNWYSDVFNINTANEFGISVWAIILDLPILINLNSIDPLRPNWGFGELRVNFNNGNFSPLASSGAQILTIDQRRLAIKMRYQQLISNGTIPNQNQILKNIFGEFGNCYVVNNQDMSIEYTFEFTIEPWIEFFYDTLLLFPTPAGVSDSLVEI